MHYTKRCFIFLAVFSVSICAVASTQPKDINAKVIAIDSENASFTLEPVDDSLKDTTTVQVGYGDAHVPYLNRIVKGKLIQSSNTLRLENIWPGDSVTAKILTTTEKSVRNDTASRGSKRYRNIGEYLPEFALFNQNAELITRPQLNGKFLVINFIFTRCAEPTMCPATTQRMVRLQNALDENKIDNVQLYSISFDPAYDTPGILHAYAEINKVDPTRYQLLSGTHQQIHDLMQQFGILINPKDGTLDHTMSTILIDPNGKFLERKDGSFWKVEDLIERLQSYIQARKTANHAPSTTPPSATSTQ